MSPNYFTPKEKLANFMKDGAMNTQEGIYLYGITDPSVMRLLPPPLELTDPKNPLFYIYIVNIREPTFAPWYLEGGIGLMAKYKDKAGVYFLNLQLSGPGALMGAYIGREGSGLPKKLCERIFIERKDTYGHCYIERNGVRLVDVALEIGNYNYPELHFEAEKCAHVPGGVTTEGGCLLHKYRVDGIIKEMELYYYDSPTHYYTWEKASATVKLNSTVDDPYADIPIVSVLGAAWSKCDNSAKGISLLHRYPQEEVAEVMQYLYAGRYDQCVLCREHQVYKTNMLF